jgi:hypothetical protein
MKRIAWALLIAVFSMACGGSETNVSSGSSGPGGAGGAGGGGSSGSAGTGGTLGDGGVCQLAPRGMFTFHVHNAGTSSMTLTYGCGAKLPIELDTPEGKLGAGPGNADGCEKSCDLIYSSVNPQCPGFCTDCALGQLEKIAAGGSTDIAWDRRVYVAKIAEQPCLAGRTCQPGNCAFGIAVAPEPNQTGRLTICTDPNAVGVSCATSRTVDFTIDTTSSEATIDAQ